MREYLVEVTKRVLRWVEASDDIEAEDIAEELEEDDNATIEGTRVIDSREIDYF